MSNSARLWPAISLILFYIFQRTSVPLLFNLEQVGCNLHNINFFFLVVFVGLLSLSYIKRIRLVVNLFIGLLSCVCCCSIALWWWSEDNVSFYEQRCLAVILLSISLWVLIARPSTEKRRHF
jgi:hypothetical protein